jgi:hypothetical protein
VHVTGLAQQVGAAAILSRIEESEAAKFLSTASWYLEVNDPISAEQSIRRLVQRHPTSIATLEALRIVPDVLKQVPESVVKNAPDYRAMRRALLKVDWDEMPAAETIPPASIPPASTPPPPSEPAPQPDASGAPKEAAK